MKQPYFNIRSYLAEIDYLTSDRGTACCLITVPLYEDNQVKALIIKNVNYKSSAYRR